MLLCTHATRQCNRSTWSCMILCKHTCASRRTFCHVITRVLCKGSKSTYRHRHRLERLLRRCALQPSAWLCRRSRTLLGVQPFQVRAAASCTSHLSCMHVCCKGIDVRALYVHKLHTLLFPPHSVTIGIPIPLLSADPPSLKKQMSRGRSSPAQ